MGLDMDIQKIVIISGYLVQVWIGQNLFGKVKVIQQKVIVFMNLKMYIVFQQVLIVDITDGETIWKTLEEMQHFKS